ncbi:heparin-binding EGF-like growth factor a [Osmerus eperlanus]|uniref:heparin-binding EGF-like growth factor a n=1 Tax=Osmerus eperlanus TaxID=29151 RepID=UPI002E137A2B
MRILRVAFLLVHAFVLSRLVNGAAVDRYDESARPQQHTSVINLLDVSNDNRIEEDNAVVNRPSVTLEYDEEDDEEYYEDEEEDYLSGDYENGLPRVAFSSKPQNPSTILNAERPEGKIRRGKGQKRGKGKGKKRNPCLKKYKDYCIHGTCQYLRDIREPSCICHHSYSGHRCEFFALPVGKVEGGYNRTTALAVVAVVLSSLCLTIIGLLLALRFHKRGGYDVENEEKVKLGSAPNH